MERGGTGGGSFPQGRSPCSGRTVSVGTARTGSFPDPSFRIVPIPRGKWGVWVRGSCRGPRLPCPDVLPASAGGSCRLGTCGNGSTVPPMLPPAWIISACGSLRWVPAIRPGHGNEQPQPEMAPVPEGHGAADGVGEDDAESESKVCSFGTLPPFSGTSELKPSCFVTGKISRECRFNELGFGESVLMKEPFQFVFCTADLDAILVNFWDSRPSDLRVPCGYEWCTRYPGAG